MPSGGLRGGDPSDERGARDAEGHRLGVVAVDAGDRMRHVLAGFRIFQGVELLEPDHEVAVAQLLHRDVGRGVAVDARAGLADFLPFGVLLVGQHVGVAALLAKILGEGVAGPHPAELRDRVELALGDDVARVVVGRHMGDRLAAAVAGLHHVGGLPVVVVLQGKVLAPLRRILRCRRQFRRRE